MRVFKKAESEKTSVFDLKNSESRVAFCRDLGIEEASLAGHSGLGDVAARFVISTAGVDRDQDVIYQKGFDLANYKLNPLVFFDHQSKNLPIGKDVGIMYDSDRDLTIGVCRFVSRELDEFGWKIGQFVKAGALSACSVGFTPLEVVSSDRRRHDATKGYDILRAELHEWSVVTVPANADCVLDGKSLAAAGLVDRDVLSLIERLSESDPLGQELRKRIAIPEKFFFGSKRKGEKMEPEQIEESVPEEPVIEGPAEVYTCPECGHSGEVTEFKPALPAEEIEEKFEEEVIELAKQIARQILQNKKGL